MFQPDMDFLTKISITRRNFYIMRKLEKQNIR